MDLSLVIRTIRDIYNRVGFAHLKHVYVEKKDVDGSLVTDIDPLIEEIVLDWLRLNGDVAVVREEAANPQLTIGQIKEKQKLVTVDGIDGTDDFIRHFNRSTPNSRWLVAMTAVYQRNAEGLYVPEFSFAFQPYENRLFVAFEQSAFVVLDPLGKTVSLKLDAANLVREPKKGSIDVYTDKQKCRFTVSDHHVGQKGPSGFNLASLAAACASKIFDGAEAVNFTTFHYKLWDFGLWPVLKNAGIVTTRKTEDGLESVDALNLNWFGDDDVIPGKCEDTPLIMSNDATFDPLVPK